MLAQTLALALSARGFDCTVAQLTGPETVLDQAVRLGAALVLLDLNVDEADGLELIPRLREIGAKVLVVTGCTDESPVAAALALGASGWLNKAQPFERLLDAAESVMRNRPLFGNARFSHNFAIGWSFPLAAGNPYQGAGGTVLLQSTYTGTGASGTGGSGTLGASTGPSGGQLAASTPTTGAALPETLAKLLLGAGFLLALAGVLLYLRGQRTRPFQPSTGSS